MEVWPHPVYRWLFWQHRVVKNYDWVMLRWACIYNPGEHPSCPLPPPATWPYYPATDPSHLDPNFLGTRAFEFGCDTSVNEKFSPTLFWEASVNSQPPIYMGSTSMDSVNLGTKIIRKKKKNLWSSKKQTWICLCSGSFYIVLDIVNNLKMI